MSTPQSSSIASARPNETPQPPINGVVMPTLISAQAPLPGKVRRTRASAAWFGICAAAIAAVLLIIFMLQNTRSVEVDFLGFNGNAPLALALLIAAVGAAILTMGVAVTRMIQLRRDHRDS